tara:strand:+ start:530 stop:718 length:189 start_codon:yes stop_codon:yes gene_type:complete
MEKGSVKQHQFAVMRTKGTRSGKECAKFGFKEKLRICQAADFGQRYLGSAHTQPGGRFTPWQ